MPNCGILETLPPTHHYAHFTSRNSGQHALLCMADYEIVPEASVYLRHVYIQQQLTRLGSHTTAVVWHNVEYKASALILQANLIWVAC